LISLTVVKLFSAQKQGFSNPLIFFSFVIFLVSTHDGIISYIAPVLINNKLNDTFLVGLILSISSIFGVLFDLLVSKFFPKKSYIFFVSWMLIFALLVPLCLLILPNTIATFVLAMIAWSVYYEFRNYSKYDFINRSLPPHKNIEAWSTITSFQSTAYIIGPIITTYFLSSGAKIPLYASISIVLIAILVFTLFAKNFGKKHKIHNEHSEPRGFLKGLKVLHILTKRVWPLVIFSFALTLLDVSFWTTGVLYSEKLKLSSGLLGGLFLTAYCLPAMFVGLITTHISESLGKKKTAFISGIIAGVCLIIVGLSNNIYLTLGMVFITATFADISFILIFATFQDYVTRLDGGGTDLVGINQMTQNLAYASGPIILGLISRNGRLGNSFLLTGVILIMSSIIALSVVPRKIKMPHKILNTLLNKNVG